MLNDKTILITGGTGTLDLKLEPYGVIFAIFE